MSVIGLRLDDSNEESRWLSGLSLACGPSEEGSDELMGNPSRARRLGFQHFLSLPFWIQDNVSSQEAELSIVPSFVRQPLLLSTHGTYFGSVSRQYG